MAKVPKTGAARQPQSVAGESGSASKQPVDQAVYSALFVSMVLSMTWQLAIVVILPIIGGYWLDQRLHSSPVATLAGLVLAILGMVAILWRTVRVADVRVAGLERRSRK